VEYYGYTTSILAYGQGGAIFVWEDWREGIDSLYAQRFNSSGDPLWQINGTRISTTQNGFEPKL